MIPIILILFCRFVIVPALVSCILKIKNSKKNVIKVIVFSLVAITFLSNNLITLLRGGIYLLFENENDSVIISGTIEDQIELTSLEGRKYKVHKNYGRGEALIINGTKYFIISYGDFKKGDVVTLRILPKSKIVLGIDYSDQDTLMK